jgi:signal transduction histidine kinase
MADQIAVALWRGQLYEAVQKRSERLATLNAVSSAVLSSLEPEMVMEQILRVTRQAFEAPEASVLLRDRSTGELRFALTSSAEGGGNPALNGVRLEAHQGIVGWVVDQDRSVRVDSVRDDPRWYSGVDDKSGFRTQSLISAPLKRGEEIIGALEIVGDRKAAFTDEDLSLLEAVCSIAAVGLENARLYAAMRSHADRLALLHQLGHALSATLDYEIMVGCALSRIRDIFSADGAWFVEPDGTSGGLRLAAAVTDHAALDQPAPLTAESGVASWAFDHAEPVLVKDTSADQRFSDEVDQQLGIQTRAMMASPLTTTDRLLGAVAVSSSQPEAYERGDLNTLQAIAATMSMALENALLYENLKALLREREETEAQLIQNEKMSALGRLMASITHEVNNPLQAIQGCLTLAGEEMDGRQRQEKLRRYVEVALTEIGHIADIVERARAFYRSEPRGSRVVDVHAVLDSLLTLSKKQLEYSDVVVERDWAEDLPQLVAQPGQLRQVFLNLVLNAIDAMPTGGTLTIRTAVDRMPVDSEGEPGPVVRVEFSDTGQGISPDVAPCLFEPFVTSKEDGTGLGLFVSYGIVEAHGGEISVSSQPDRGTTVTILLPSGQTRDSSEET